MSEVVHLLLLNRGRVCVGLLYHWEHELSCSLVQSQHRVFMSDSCNNLMDNAAKGQCKALSSLSEHCKLF